MQTYLWDNTLSDQEKKRPRIAIKELWDSFDPEPIQKYLFMLYSIASIQTDEDLGFDVNRNYMLYAYQQIARHLEASYLVFKSKKHEAE